MGYYLKTNANEAVAGKPPFSFKYTPPVLTPEEQAVHDKIMSMHHTVSEEFQKHVGRVFAQAILDFEGGVMPSNEDLQKYARTLIMHDGTYLLSWRGPDPKPGEPVDLSYVIARVPPPKLFNPDKPEQ